MTARSRAEADAECAAAEKYLIAKFWGADGSVSSWAVAKQLASSGVTGAVKIERCCK